jgi:cellulose synthase/poly-beta-1,6-N-acetylglucosamine synthase-like glycosyltransferase
MSFVGSHVNRGVGAARNALLARARGPHLFALDADNGVYPTALARLEGALVSQPDADFAYSAIAVFNGGRPQNLLSARTWDPSLFRGGNFLDNMALYRTSTLREIGGWDESLPNWEDFQLWLRLAERGRKGAFVPQALSWYRVFEGSRSQETPRHVHDLWVAMREAAPTVLADSYGV